MNNFCPRIRPVPTIHYHVSRVTICLFHLFYQSTPTAAPAAQWRHSPPYSLQSDRSSDLYLVENNNKKHRFTPNLGNSRHITLSHYFTSRHHRIRENISPVDSQYTVSLSNTHETRRPRKMFFIDRPADFLAGHDPPSPRRPHPVRSEDPLEDRFTGTRVVVHAGTR